MTGAGPEAGRSILITRPGSIGATSALVQARGYRPVVAPMLAVAPAAPSLPAGVQAILVTSSNALPALTPGPTKLLAVGDATASRARALGFTEVASAGGDAADLAALAARLADPSGPPLLLASGAGQGHALAADLRARGFRVVRRVCYAARPVRRFPDAAAEALRSGRLHAVLFLSAETAATFVRLLPPELHDSVKTVAALAIGQTTVAALEPLPWLLVCRARTPTLDDVLALI